MLYKKAVIRMDTAVNICTDAIICVGEEKNINEKDIELLSSARRGIHRIKFNFKCERWRTEYSGFYIPKKIISEKPFLVYSFGIGEDLLFSEEVIARGGICYAFDPIPKAIKYFETRDCIHNFYEMLRNKNFYDCYGTEREPTFIKIENL